MEIKKTGGFKKFFKRFGTAIGAGALVLALTATGLAVGLTQNKTVTPPNDDQQVSTNDLNFVLPMSNPEIIKDFSATELQEYGNLNEWAAHKAMDITSSDGFVYSVLAGNVLDVGYDYMVGQYIVIQHTDGFVSTYGSLAQDVLVQKGDKVEKGQKLGVVAQTATTESDLDSHLHFTLELNNKKVDPNNYIEFQNK